MDVFVSGPNIGNLAVTLGLVALLLVLSTKANILDRNGALAASLLGLVVGGLGHWTWLIILLGFLLSSHKATKWRFEEKLALGLSESNDGHRGWTNVVANGAIPGFMCLIAIAVQDWEAMVWLFGASVAVAAADTFASEIGSLDPRVRMITTFRRCEQGLNGGFSPNGQIAALVGSSVVAALTFVAWFLTANEAGAGLNGVFLAIALAIVGWVGCQIDSLLGALLENRGYLTKGSVNALSIAGGVVIMLAVLAQSS
jgi:uncharacterized protein (TIGR00297 family)